MARDAFLLCAALVVEGRRSRVMREPRAGVQSCDAKANPSEKNGKKSGARKIEGYEAMERWRRKKFFSGIAGHIRGAAGDS